MGVISITDRSDFGYGGGAAGRHTRMRLRACLVSSPVILLALSIVTLVFRGARVRRATSAEA